MNLMIEQIMYIHVHSNIGKMTQNSRIEFKTGTLSIYCKLVLTNDAKKSPNYNIYQ